MIAIACDHAGFKLKNQIIKHFSGKVLPCSFSGESQKLEFKDLGADSEQSVDYPDFAKLVAFSVAAGESKVGFLICGSGIGMSIAANKVGGIRAALVEDAERAKLTRQHNDANVLVLGARFLENEAEVYSIIENFLTTKFEGGRHKARVDKIEK